MFSEFGELLERSGVAVIVVHHSSFIMNTLFHCVSHSNFEMMIR